VFPMPGEVSDCMYCGSSILLKAPVTSNDYQWTLPEQPAKQLKSEK
jgi:DNA-directed RNA polymerase subunit RPC12/RpoP